MNPEGKPKAANDNEVISKKVWSRSDAIAEIGLLRQQAMQSGSVDSENDELSRLIIDIRNEKIGAEDAVKQAHAIIQNRQDYH